MLHLCCVNYFHTCIAPLNCVLLNAFLYYVLRKSWLHLHLFVELVSLSRSRREQPVLEGGRKVEKASREEVSVKHCIAHICIIIIAMQCIGSPITFASSSLAVQQELVGSKRMELVKPRLKHRCKDLRQKAKWAKRKVALLMFSQTAREEVLTSQIKALFVGLPTHHHHHHHHHNHCFVLT